MLKYDDIDTIHENLFALAKMINYKSSDPYIKSMYQYIVNPLAWIVTEKALRTSKNNAENDSFECPDCGAKFAVQDLSIINKKPNTKSKF